MELLQESAPALDNSKHVNAILENIADGFVAFDRDFHFIYVNRAAEQIAGKSRNEMLGQFLWDVFPELVDTSVYHNYIRAIDEQVIVEFEECLLTTGRWVELRVSPSPQGLAVYVKDIHERKLVEKALRDSEQRYRKLAEEADAANKAKDRFLAVLSHELRTPLMPLLGTAESLLHDARLPAPLREDIRTIQRNVQLEGRLIDDMLDLVRITRGKVDLRIAAVRLDKVVIRALRICRAEMRAKGQKLTFQLYVKQKYVRGDPVRIQQILWNLLRNAIKFTPNGGHISVELANRSDGLTAVSICDDGIGIDPAMFARVFEPFEQVEGADDRNGGGLGLGLAITKALVEAQGGTIVAHSPGSGRGATFTFTLPASDAGENACQPDPEERPSARRPLRILLVEDHPDTMRVMAKILVDWGHTVLTASDVKSALQLAASAEFDVLISDLGLPDGSGLELMEKLRSRRPVTGIALSGYGMERDKEESLNAGFPHHLTKPVNFESFDALLQKLASCGGTSCDGR
jgi:PAS domain S-box-containing protein